MQMRGVAVGLGRREREAVGSRLLAAALLFLSGCMLAAGCDFRSGPPASPGKVDFSRAPSRPSPGVASAVKRRGTTAEVSGALPSTPRAAEDRSGSPWTREERGTPRKIVYRVESTSAPDSEEITSRRRAPAASIPDSERIESLERLRAQQKVLLERRQKIREELEARRAELERLRAREESTRESTETDELTDAIDWRPIFQGIDHVRVRATSPRQMEGQALRIHLDEEGIEFFATPPSNGAGDTLGLRTSTFLTQFGCQVAINAAEFSPIHSSEGRSQRVRGLQVSRGQVVSANHYGRPALLVTRDNRASISAPPFELDGVYTAVGGFDIVLDDGRATGDRRMTHPRVAAGVSKDGSYVYLLVIDGRQYGWSMGATKRDVGSWLKRLGAWDGINLDGGGTTTMVMSDGRGGYQLLNRPIHNGSVGNQRISGSHLGVMARPLQ